MADNLTFGGGGGVEDFDHLIYSIIFFPAVHYLNNVDKYIQSTKRIFKLLIKIVFLQGSFELLYYLQV